MFHLLSTEDLRALLLLPSGAAKTRDGREYLRKPTCATNLVTYDVIVGATEEMRGQIRLEAADPTASCAEEKSLFVSRVEIEP